MSKITVLVQASHVVFDDKGSQMSPGKSYSVNDTPLIERLINDGALSRVNREEPVAPVATAPKEEAKKPAVNQKNSNSKNMEVTSTETTGEL